MPRGFDSSRDPNRDVTRNSIVQRIISRFTDAAPAVPSVGPPAAVGGRTPPPPPTGNRTQPPRSLAREYAVPNQVYSLQQNTAPNRASAMVERSRVRNARVSDQVSRGGHQGTVPNLSLGQWRTEESRAGRRPR